MATVLQSSIKTRKVNLAKGGRIAAYAVGGGAIVAKELPVAPAAVVGAREKEKVALQELNERFASYIEKVRFLEADNRRLQGLLDQFQAKFDELDATLKAQIATELVAARAALDQTTADKAGVELQVARLQAEVDEWTARANAEIEAHNGSKAAIVAFEKLTAELNGQIDFLTQTNISWETQAAGWKAQIASLQKEVSLARQAGDAEVVARVGLEAVVQSKDDEIAYLNAMWEEKVKTLLSIDYGSADFQAAFANELGAALRDIRGEYDSIIAATKSQDTDAFYRAKFAEVMAATQRATAELSDAKAQLAAARAKHQDFTSQIVGLQGQLGGANGRIASLEAEVGAAWASVSATTEEKEAVIAGLRAEITGYIGEMKALTDAKLFLDAEIATYKRLVAGEEARFFQIMPKCGGYPL
jgi:intermediate filament protein if